jgi:hypothetical protein
MGDLRLVERDHAVDRVRVLRVPARGSCDATASSAAFSATGSSRPRLLARLRIPRHARGLKKYRGGRSPVSKISDKKDTLASLGESEMLRIEHSPRHTVPELVQRSEEASEGLAVIGRESAGDVFPDDPAGLCALSKSDELEGQLTTRVSHSTSESGNAEGLTGCSSE